uniref:Protein V n=1 Tax=Bat mastadenovirus TaxID=740971 RepID=A0A8G0W1I6_9ADEN|nr:protein V [Bat mastadenovirus]
MVTRKIKEEMLAVVEPEFYPDYKRKRAVKREFKEEPDVVYIKSEPGDVKPFVKREIKKGRVKKAKKDEDYSGDVKFEGQVMSKRRPYQWKGRRVKKILRPGVPVIFTPGQRSGVALKRSNEELFADEDILEQAEKLEGEFAYGKHLRMDYGEKPEYVPLSMGNPTPSLKPVTEQKVVKVAKKRGRNEYDELQPTVQMLEGKRRRPNEPDVGFSEVQDVKIRPIKQVADNVAVATVDVEMPQAAAAQMIEAMDAQPSTSRAALSALPTITPMETQSSTVRTMAVPTRKHKNRYPLGKNYGKANSIMPQVIYHPSIKQGPSTIVSTARRRRTTSSRRRSTGTRRRRRTTSSRARPAVRVTAGAEYYPSSSGRRTTRKGVRLPMVRYHPSISRTSQPRGIIPTVRYHPSISY